MCGFVRLSGKISFCVCLVQSGLNEIFHQRARYCIFNRSLLSVKVYVFWQFTILNKEASSAKILTFESSSCTNRSTSLHQNQLRMGSIKFSFAMPIVILKVTNNAFKQSVELSSVQNGIKTIILRIPHGLTMRPTLFNMILNEFLYCIIKAFKGP